MTALHRARLLAHRVGIDIHRHPDPASAVTRRVRALKAHRVDLVIDVGAATGLYARELRTHGYDGRIISCEPLPQPYTRLVANARRDPGWETLNVAVGDTVGRAVMNVAGNSDSSSMLPMLPSHLAAAPDSEICDQEDVSMTTIDEMISEDDDSSASFLKLDVQGFEHVALAGAERSMPHIAGVQVELSLVPLYDGGLLMDEMTDRLASLGFELWGIEPGFSDPRTGRLLQVDGVFFRP